ncbi:MAG: cell division protein FtsQ/DivIB [Rhizobiaceae bacterium]
MFALAGKGSNGRYAAADAGLQSDRTLPRVLRKPVRILTRLASGQVTFPKHTGTLSAFLFLLASGVYGAMAGGQTNAILQASTAHVGFGISEVKVSGHSETSEIDVLAVLNLNSNSSLIGFDTNAARARLAQMPWVASVEVSKLYPNALSVTMEERKPFAIWQHDEELSLIEEGGNIIVPFAHQEFANLPLVTGPGADREAKYLVPAVAAIPELKSRVKAQMLVAGRRWDIRLDNGVTIQLPAGDPAQALKDLAQMDSATGLLSKDIELVDLRVPDRVVVRLTASGSSVHEGDVKTMLDAAKKAEKHT